MKICAKCFHEKFPGKRVTRVSLGRQCGLCKVTTEKTDELIVVEEGLVKS